MDYAKVIVCPMDYAKVIVCLKMVMFCGQDLYGVGRVQYIDLKMYMYLVWNKIKKLLHSSWNIMCYFYSMLHFHKADIHLLTK